MTDLQAALQAGGLGVVGLLLLVIWSILTGKLRMAREVERLERELERERGVSAKWEEQALRALDVSKRLGTAVAATAQAPTQPPGN